MKYLAWGLLLAVQNASFTWVSRARNGNSYAAHAVAAVFSNGIWFVSQLILIEVAVKSLKHPSEIVIAATVYIVSTVTGSVFMHWLCRNKLEKKSK